MPDILSHMTDEEIKELAEAEARKARHEAEARKNNPLLYDKLDNYCYWLDVLTRDRSGNVEKTVANLCRVLEYDFALNGICYNLLSESPASRAASSHTTFATPARSARSRRCTRSVAASSRPPTTRAACATTA